MMTQGTFEAIMTAIQDHHAMEGELNGLIGIINSSHTVVEYTVPLHKAFWMLMRDTLGEEKVGWIEWWLYERDKDSSQPQAWDAKKKPIPMETIGDLYVYIIAMKE